MAESTIKHPTLGSYLQPTGLFINNKFVASVEGRTLDVINPANESLICTLQEAGASDVDIAVKAARHAFEGPWKQVSPEGRSKMLIKLSELVEENMQLLASVESLDNGKPLSLAMRDVEFVSSVFRYYGGFADKIEGRVVDTNPQSLNYVKREPYGVCGLIISWNFPILMLSWKIAPAIAAGNTVVLKTAEQTPLSALLFAKFVEKAGFPPGVINIISGVGRVTGAALTLHNDVDKIAFTGSSGVGRMILRAAADSNLKKVTLELGGKSPNVIFNDAPIDDAVSWANMGIFYNQGQACCAGSRVFVQEGIYDEFVKRFRERAAKNVVGDPFDAQSFNGPVVSKLQFDKILGYIEQGKKEGAKIESGGDRVGKLGYYIQPTIFSNVKPDMKIMKEEIFGPVCCITKFSTIDEAIKMANNTEYGLAAAVHTQNINTAIEVSNRIKAGTVWVNNYNMLHHQLPFGGFKQSGMGRELGSCSIDEYTQVKTVNIRLAGPLIP